MLAWIGNLFPWMASESSDNNQTPMTPNSKIPVPPPLPKKKESFTGPARNAPAGGINIKVVFQQSPQVIVVTEDDIKKAIGGLRKTSINAQPPLREESPIERESKTIFATGNDKYFESVRKRREAAKLSPVKVSNNVEILDTTDSAVEQSVNVVISPESTISCGDVVISVPQGTNCTIVQENATVSNDIISTPVMSDSKIILSAEGFTLKDVMFEVNDFEPI